MRRNQLFWLECTVADLPSDVEWLGENERLRYDQLRLAKRRADWLLGRWTAKSVVSDCLGMLRTPSSFRDIQILPDAAGVPVAQIGGSAVLVSLSISHRDGRALAVVGAPVFPIGCDLEIVESRGLEFMRTFFTEAEIESCHKANRGGELETLIWSAKESTLKMLSVGLRADTRSVSIDIDSRGRAESSWNPFTALVVDGHIYTGWWRVLASQVRTIISSRQSKMPRETSAIS
ncbi:4'-phosphopantetheinyl transferase [Candidatus Koribacter versatilis Ellin345]|uniref:4'-phosphopantetheinyl transferase n=1 Tax=Koribacter versatilis (strain Ellin345) TaxID=204669 RepID=Q1IUH8_KORVE|nr:4'-phosphopantetheinyl transferase superfamily protein [Candidatus Koribacter versatilis]ABF39472.1 4'-phosphopantetheinyl transferase [Candidatus Koribacter versatilis Ellin345]